MNVIESYTPLYSSNNIWSECTYKINVYINKNIKYSELLMNGKKNGYCCGINLTTKQKTFEGNYVNDCREGFCRWFYEDGSVSLEAIYKNDKRNGFFQNFYANGMRKSCGFFINDAKVGNWYYWSEDGTMNEKNYL